MKQYVIGMDIGTTCTKVIVIDENGKIAGQGSKGYELLSVGAGVEQRAEDWISAAKDAICQAVSHIDCSCIKGVSCSTQGGSTVAVREDGSFIGNSWTWMDRRSIRQAREIEELIGNEYIYRSTGSRISPALDAAKLRNMKSDPLFQDATHFLTTLEVINYWLTGNPAIDPSNAAMRQLMNIDSLDWDDNILQAAGICRNELPSIHPAGSLIGTVAESASAVTGLPVGTPVFNGAHDQYCASIGAGAIQAGDMLLSAGTTWVLMGITEKPMYTDSFIVPGRHPIDGLYGAIASLVGSGASMQWYHNNLMSSDFDIMNEVVPERKESTRGLFFFPYLNGAPYPIHNHKAKGVFAGLTLEHDQFDLARAIMEGVAFGVRRAVEDFKSNGAEISSITMMGGASKSPVWMQMIASIAGVPIKRLNCSDVCAIGAAMIAACGCGLFDTYRTAADTIVSVEHIYVPNPEDQAYYNDKFTAFDRLWTCLNAYYEGEKNET